MITLGHNEDYSQNKLLVVEFEINSHENVVDDGDMDNAEDDVCDSIDYITTLANRSKCFVDSNYDLEENDYDSRCEVYINMKIKGNVENLKTFLSQLADKNSENYYNYYTHDFICLTRNLNAIIEEEFNNNLVAAASNITTADSDENSSEVSLYM